MMLRCFSSMPDPSQNLSTVSPGYKREDMGAGLGSYRYYAHNNLGIIIQGSPVTAQVHRFPCKEQPRRSVSLSLSCTVLSGPQREHSSFVQSKLYTVIIHCEILMRCGSSGPLSFSYRPSLPDSREPGEQTQ